MTPAEIDNLRERYATFYIQDEVASDDINLLIAAVEKAQRERDELRKAIRDISTLITTPGPRPEWHWKILRRHQEEWPKLWTAISRARALLAKETT